ncbi:MAG: pyridoxal phosphate-dependent aminotransferase [Clostridia bacterium]|nr:pyridoxal phosphate-dependent aminotransferase [Clostridia bacterium]
MVTERIKRMTPSATIELEGTVAELKAAGVNVIGLNAGEPDFNTPENIVKACEKAIESGQTKYISVTGIMPLREAICKKLKKDNNVEYKPKEIVVSTGAKQALYNAVLTVCSSGDEVIIPTPCWVSYVEMVKLADAVPVLVDTDENFQLDIAAIEKAITPKTKAIIINTPNNPTGAVYTEKGLYALGQLAVKYNFYVISDEVYEKLIYDGCKHICIASLSEDIKAHSIIINGFSKAYAMTGWRIGYSAAPLDVAKGIASLQGHTTSNSTTFVQWAALEALEGPSETIEFMRKKFDERRVYLLERLRNMPGITCSKADGAFYLMPDISSYFGKCNGDKSIDNSIDFCNYMLEEAHLAIVPGAAFEAPKTVRIAYSNSLENIKEGMDNMEKALAKLK